MRQPSNARSLGADRRPLDRSAVRGLRSVLAAFGYDIVPAIRSGNARGARRSKRLACPRCSRRFAYPMNVGRHLAATHGRKKQAA